MLINELKLIELFCELDDFCLLYEPKMAAHSLLPTTGRHLTRKPVITLSEMMTLEITYHLSGYKCFEYYYHNEVENGPLHACFPHAPSYNRFVELKPRMLTALFCYLHLLRLGRFMQCYYADSTPLKACHNRRIHQHKVMAGLAQRGQCSTGWFYGCKLFLVVNAFGEIVQAFVAPGNVADNAAATLRKLLGNLKGEVYADKGFINQKLFEELLTAGLKLVTKLRSNMKNKLMLLREKWLLQKRGIVESVIDILKSVCDIEHTRHRSAANMLVNTYAALCAYSFLDRKPSIRF
jgi:hypothetical protein